MIRNYIKKEIKTNNKCSEFLIETMNIFLDVFYGEKPDYKNFVKELNEFVIDRENDELYSLFDELKALREKYLIKMMMENYKDKDPNSEKKGDILVYLLAETVLNSVEALSIIIHKEILTEREEEIDEDAPAMA